MIDLMRRLLYILSIVLLVAGCTGVGEGSHAGFAPIPVAGWGYGDTLLLVPDPGDSVAVGRLAVAVRHTDGYSYRNLWLEVSVPCGDTLRADTLDLRLSDSYGRWLGRGSGVSYMKTDTMPAHIRLVRGDTVRVRHIMRVDTLEDIEQVGVIFIPDR